MMHKDAAPGRRDKGNGRIDRTERDVARERLARRQAASSKGRVRRAHDFASERDAVAARASVADAVGCSDGRQAQTVRIPRFLIFAAGAFVLAAVFAGIALIERSCSSPQAPDDAVSVVEEQAPPEPVQADFSLLPDGVSADVAQALQERARDPRVAAIVNDAQAYVDTFGIDEALKLFELAAEDEQALDFVAGVLGSYPATIPAGYPGPVEAGSVPLLFQWDTRWGYLSYCAGPLGLTGCCPTSLSMVYMGLTGKTDMTPADMASLSARTGYAEDGRGTYGSFLVDTAPTLGLRCEQFVPAAADLMSRLRDGWCVICNVGPGDFTEAGHFFVITGVADDGTIAINDPYSSVNSSKTWDLERVVNQSIAMYAFKAA
ncbi:MAG: papain-like cysteine protease family protein [Slackia sp.]|nr:papain-like cysteine protease family protein [Slackia sp.]